MRLGVAAERVAWVSSPDMLAADGYWPGKLCKHPNHSNSTALRLRACSDDPWPAVSLVIKASSKDSWSLPLFRVEVGPQRSSTFCGTGGCKERPINIYPQSTVHSGRLRWLRFTL